MEESFQKVMKKNLGWRALVIPYNCKKSKLLQSGQQLLQNGPGLGYYKVIMTSITKWDELYF